MKLILTSSGLGTSKLRREFSNMLEKRVALVKVMVIHTAKKSEHLVYVNEVGKELGYIGVLHPNITYFNIARERSSPKISDYDAVYVCGGNTFYILDRIRKTGLERAIKKFVGNGGLYVGVSAGSIIAGQDIEIAGWGSEGDLNEINLKDLRGLHLTDIAIFPHYKLRLRKEVEGFKQRVTYPIEVAKDGEAIIIKGRNIKKIKRD